MKSQIKYKNWHNFGSRFDFNRQLFLKKVIFLEGVSLNKIKFHKIKCLSWSAVTLYANLKLKFSSFVQVFRYV